MCDTLSLSAYVLIAGNFHDGAENCIAKDVCQRAADFTRSAYTNKEHKFLD